MFLLACKVSFEKSADSGNSLVGNQLLFSCCFKILSLYFTFGILIVMCLGVNLFGLIFFGTLCASWIYMSTSFTNLGVFSMISFSNKFSISYSLSSPSSTPTMQMSVRLMLSQRLLTLSSFWGGSFSSCCSD